MKIHKGDAVKYNAILIRVGKYLKKAYITGYGYAMDNEYNNLVYIDNGIRIDLVHTYDIEINYGQNKVFQHKNDPIDADNNDDA